MLQKLSSRCGESLKVRHQLPLLSAPGKGPFLGKWLEKSWKDLEAKRGETEPLGDGVCALRPTRSRQHTKLGRGLMPSCRTERKKAAGALAWFRGVSRGAKSVWQVFNACISNGRLLAPFKQW